MRTKLVPDMYEKVRNLVKNVVASAVGDWASLTTDIWTSDAKDSYISLTLHFLNDSFEQKMVVLGCFPFNAEHSAANILKMVEENVAEFDITDKIHCFVRDNAANMVAAFDISVWSHVGCFLHILQVISNGLYCE